MRPLVSPEEMARADQAAIAAGTPAEVLMERAGEAVASAALELAGGRYGRRAAVVCGKGNNGGDGFVAARRLAREGLGVRCLLVGEVRGVEGAAKTHLDRLQAAGVSVEAFDAKRLTGSQVVVDALFGTGFRGPAEGPAAQAIESMTSCSAPVVAVDIPSGVDGTTGRTEGPAVRAQVTIAMGAEKTGTALSDGAVHAGEVRVVDIGLPVQDVTDWLAEGADVVRVVPRRRLDAHKRSGGAVAVLAGSSTMSGAALLVCRGAMRAGAGYATLGSTAEVVAAKGPLLPEVLSAIVSDGPTLGPEAIDEFDAVLARAQALAIGPGLGRGEEQHDLVARALEEVTIPVVLDADGLNVLAGHRKVLERRTRPTVVTPHPAELARLVNSDVEQIQQDRLDAARRAATRLGCVVLLKGWRTVVADPSGHAVVNATGGPELATAGTGDVLTGAIAALMAAGLGPFEAAWAAAYVHGLAGTLAGRRWGAGALAWDVAEALGEAARLLESPEP